MLPKNTGLVHLPALMSSISRCIYVIRGHKVMLDVDLAELYGMTTKRLNEQVKRNRKRFPTDFMFRLTVNEAETVISLRSQIATFAGWTVFRGETDAAAWRYGLGYRLHELADGTKHLPEPGIIFLPHLAQLAYQFLTPRGELAQLHKRTHDHDVHRNGAVAV